MNFGDKLVTHLRLHLCMDPSLHPPTLLFQFPAFSSLDLGSR